MAHHALDHYRCRVDGVEGDAQSVAGQVFKFEPLRKALQERAQRYRVSGCLAEVERVVAQVVVVVGGGGLTRRDRRRKDRT